MKLYRNIKTLPPEAKLEIMAFLTPAELTSPRMARVFGALVSHDSLWKRWLKPEYLQDGKGLARSIFLKKPAMRSAYTGFAPRGKDYVDGLIDAFTSSTDLSDFQMEYLESSLVRKELDYYCDTAVLEAVVKRAEQMSEQDANKLLAQDREPIQQTIGNIVSAFRPAAHEAPPVSQLLRHIGIKLPEEYDDSLTFRCSPGHK